MKKQIKSLEIIKEQLEGKHELRDNKFWDRSDDWQESDNGQAFEDRTNELQECIDELDGTIDKLKEL